MGFSLQNITNLYITSTFLLFGYTFIDVYKKADNYFSASLIYMDDVITNFIFYNLVFSLGILFYKLCIFLFFVDVKQNQSIKMLDKLKAKVLDVFLFCYILEGQVQINSFICLIFIFFSFILHQMAIFRSDFLINTPVTLSLNLNYRLTALYLIIGFVDFQILKYSIELLYSQQSTYFIFVYYQILMTLSIIFPMIKYFMDFYQKYTLCHIPNAQQNLSLLNLVISIPRLITQISLSICLAVKFNIFFYLIFTVIELISELTTTIKSYRRIRKLTNTMKNLKKIDEQQIKKHHDNTCMVCFQDMTQATLLPCKHFFHQDCLKQWIIKNSNHFCPKCKKQFNFDNKDQQNKKQAQVNQVNLNERVDRQRANKQRQRYFKKLEEKMRLKQEYKKNKLKQKLKQKNYIKQMKKQQNQQKKEFEQNFTQNSKFEQIKKQQKIQNKYDNMIQLQQQQKPQFTNLIAENIPLESAEQRIKTKIRIGSLPFGLPTQAVYKRTSRHIFLTDVHDRVNQNLIKDFGLKDNQLLLLLDNV